MDIISGIKSILVAKNVIGPEKEVTKEMRLNEDLGVDSLAMVRLVSAIKAEFGFQVKARDMGPDNFATVATLAAYIKKRLSE